MLPLEKNLTELKLYTKKKKFEGTLRVNGKMCAKVIRYTCI